MIRELLSQHSFAATVDRLRTAIEAAGLTVFAVIDHAANAADAGLAMLPATVLIYGNAKGGTPIMQAVPNLALDLPLRVLVRQDADDRVRVLFHPAATMLRAAGAPDALATRLDPAQGLLISAIQS
jgi:uncharacterized protein (DUF302 family)